MNTEKLKAWFEHLLMRFNYLDPSNDYVQPVDYRYVAHTPNQSHEKRMEAARAYLRKRGKYFIEQRGGWIPTKAAETDVKKTWNQYLISQGRSVFRVAK
jgi:hypothetical protein